MPKQSIRVRVFYAIRHQDVELAENFAARCPEVEDIKELNHFFRMILSQYEEDSRVQRECLDDTMSLEDWLRHFETTVLPFLRRHRFPPITSRNVVSPYTTALPH